MRPHSCTGNRWETTHQQRGALLSQTLHSPALRALIDARVSYDVCPGADPQVRGLEIDDSLAGNGETLGGHRQRGQSDRFTGPCEGRSSSRLRNESSWCKLLALLRLGEWLDRRARNEPPLIVTVSRAQSLQLTSPPPAHSSGTPVSQCRSTGRRSAQHSGQGLHCALFGLPLPASWQRFWPPCGAWRQSGSGVIRRRASWPDGAWGPRSPGLPRSGSRPSLAPPRKSEHFCSKADTEVWVAFGVLNVADSARVPGFNAIGVLSVCRRG